MTGPEEPKARTLDEIRSVKRGHEAGWLALEGVVAVGVGRLSDGRDGIVVSIRENAADVRAKVPPSVDRVPIEVRVVGELRAL